MFEHRCHAKWCKMPCDPEKLMCLRHWHMVPRAIQRAVWRYYRPGQCDDKKPSAEWHEAADAAIHAVYQKEHVTGQVPVKTVEEYRALMTTLREGFF